MLEETPDRVRRAFVPDGICDDVLLLPKSEVAMWGAERHSVGVWLTGLSAAIRQRAKCGSFTHWICLMHCHNVPCAIDVCYDRVTEFKAAR